MCCVLTLCLQRLKQKVAFRHRTLIETSTIDMISGRNNVTPPADSTNPQSTSSDTKGASIPLPYHPAYDYSASSVGPSSSVNCHITRTSINTRPRPVVIHHEEIRNLSPADLVSLGTEISPDGRPRQVVIFNLLKILSPEKTSKQHLCLR